MSIFNLSKKADYGLIMLSELAKQGRGGVVSVNDLCQKRGLPKAFMAQIIQRLKTAGIVDAKEGRGGGYFLLYNPQEIEVEEALVAIEGEVAPVACQGEEQGCPLIKNCKQKGFMEKLTQDIQGVLSNYSLADLV